MIRNLLILSALLLAVIVEAKTPVLLVPGLMGSGLEFKLHHHKHMPGICSLITRNKWHKGWISVFEIAILEHCYVRLTDIECKPHELDDIGVPLCKPSLKDDHIEWRAIDYAGMDGIDYLYDLGVYNFPYFATLAKKLTGHGYTVGKDLFGASFDWRMAPASFTQKNDAYDGAYKGSDFDRLKVLVEHAYALNNEPVVIVGHSLGCVLTTSFLQHMGASWKAKYIKHSLLLAPAYGGAPDASIVLTVGESSLGLPVQSIEQRIFGTYPSMSALSQFPEWTGGDAPFITLKDGRSFSLSKLGDLVQEISGLTARQTFDAMQEWAKKVLTLPTMVETTVVLGTGFDTVASSAIHKDHEGVWKSTATSYIDGDSTVPYVSARGASDKLSAVQVAHGGSAYQINECHGSHRDFIAKDKTVDKCTWPHLKNLL